MALGKSRSCKLYRINSKEFEALSVDGVNRGLGLSQSTRTIGRKRISISDCLDALALADPYRTPLKKQRSRDVECSQSSHLESLPLDILVRILCGVNHDDLNQLFHVSKLINEATLIAKQMHFAFSTPSSKNRSGLSFNSGSDPLEDLNKLDMDSAPNAPKQQKAYRSRISSKKLADISIALFSSPEEERWPRTGFSGGRSLFAET